MGGAMEFSWKKEIILDKALCKTAGVIVFILLTTAGAYVRIPLPFTPVPLTLQTFFVVLSGAVLGASFGALSQIGYMLLGVTGLSVFTGSGSGLLYLTGPTGGYIFGFIVSSFLVGKALHTTRKSFISIFFTLMMADLLILCCGMLWLKCAFGYPFARLLLIGFFPFVPGDLAKVCAAAMLYKKIRPRTEEIF